METHFSISNLRTDYLFVRAYGSYLINIYSLLKLNRDKESFIFIVPIYLVSLHSLLLIFK